MKHVFVINPAAGKGTEAEKIQEYLENLGSTVDYDIYTTTGGGDATRYCREYCQQNEGQMIRFYACGGDGTLNEVVNGIVKFHNASLACYPCGSGDDFVKYYGGRERFLDLDSLMNSPTMPVDLIEANGRYSINVVNFGFDACVASTMAKVKRKPLIGGTNAYNTGIVKAVFTAMKNEAKIYADGELLNPSGKYLLCTVANGQYVGGGFKCAPRSVNNDGYLDVCVVRPISRFKFIKVLEPYTNGTHFETYPEIFTYRRCKKVEVEAKNGFIYVVDGEIISGHTKLTCECSHLAINFVVPPEK